MATPLLPISLLLVLFQHLLTASSSVPFARTIDDPEQELGLRLTQPKLTHFRFYWHDIQSGERPTSVPVVKPKSPSGFGGVNMIDNPLTEGPERGSKVVGRAQGMYALASQQEIGLLMAQNLVLLEDMYNGSVLTVVGRNSVYNKVREMPVVGGSGVFRFARGYVEARTYSFDPKTQDAVVRYDCFVLLHY